MLIYVFLTASVLLNIFFCWYIVGLLRKFFYISENIADAYVATKEFAIFVESMYSMESYHGEPMIQELLFRIREVLDEMETFRDVFEYMIDAELERELDGTTEEETN